MRLCCVIQYVLKIARWSLCTKSSGTMQLTVGVALDTQWTGQKGQALVYQASE